MKLSSPEYQMELNALKQCRILIIEDNAYVRDAFELILQRTGLDATVLTTGEEALELVQHQSFDVIISDHRLPGMDGMEFFARAALKTQHATKALISSYGFEGIAFNARSVGVSHFFTKPFSIQKLLIQLNTCKTQKPQAALLQDIMHKKRAT